MSSSSASIGFNRHSFSIVSYQVAWNQPQMQPERQQERRNQIASDVRFTGASTVKDVVRLTHPGEWSRYASRRWPRPFAGAGYLVSRHVFPCAHQGRKVAIFDPAMRMPVELNGPFYPAVLVESVYRELPLIEKWVAQNQLSGCKRLKEPGAMLRPGVWLLRPRQ